MNISVGCWHILSVALCCGIVIGTGLSVNFLFIGEVVGLVVAQPFLRNYLNYFSVIK